MLGAEHGGPAQRRTEACGNGMPLGAVAAPGNRHDSPLLDPTLA
ncbi:hypothetical protein [Actinocrinis puniceicyclus]|nr:hypothetical protein [Actinocrinis puniceicyclus]